MILLQVSVPPPAPQTTTAVMFLAGNFLAAKPTLAKINVKATAKITIFFILFLLLETLHNKTCLSQQM
jgi:hypothetical protein